MFFSDYTGMMSTWYTCCSILAESGNVTFLSHPSVETGGVVLPGRDAKLNYLPLVFNQSELLHSV